MMTLYGIKNCDTVRRARQWLNVHAVPHAFHDLRGDGLDAAELERWAAIVGWESLLNRRGTTWRRLTDEQRSDMDYAKALALMLTEPTLIKRPVLVHGKTIHVGFSESDYAKLCNT